MTTTPNILGYSTTGNDSSSQSWYDLAIAVNPSNANNTITGGVNLWRSTNGGSSNTCITNWSQPEGSFEYVHADIHELVYNTVDNKLYCGRAWVCNSNGIASLPGLIDETCKFPANGFGPEVWIKKYITIEVRYIVLVRK